MSDFSELCPIFQTGVLKEVMFPYIPLSGVTACGNAFLGTLTFSKAGYFTFGRTVIVTGALARRVGATLEAALTLQILHHTSETAAGTVFATLQMSVTGSAMDALTWVNMNCTAKTFTSSDILGMAPVAGAAISQGVWDIMLRYKEA